MSGSAKKPYIPKAADKTNGDMPPKRVGKARADFLNSPLDNPGPFQSFYHYVLTQAEQFVKTEIKTDLTAYNNWLHTLAGSLGFFAMDELIPLVRTLQGRARPEEIAVGSGLFLREFLKRAENLAGEHEYIPIENYFREVEKVLASRASAQKKEVRLTLNLFSVGIPAIPLFENFMISLLQLLNNHVDHGIETREDRIRTGKDPVGQIQVSLEVNELNNTLIFKFRDDGRGLDLPGIKSRASQLSLQADSKNGYHRLILMHGFSTQKELSNFSGHGEGLATVFAAVTQLGGTIEIESVPARGIEFQITVPFAKSELKLATGAKAS